MRSRPLLRVASALLALLIALAGAHDLSARSCVADDCDMPCCDRDTDNATYLPILPCCRTVSLDQAPSHPSPSTAVERPEPGAPPPVIAPPLTIVARFSAAVSTSPHLPAPPLYERHCALLL